MYAVRLLNKKKSVSPVKEYALLVMLMCACRLEGGVENSQIGSYSQTLHSPLSSHHTFSFQIYKSENGFTPEPRPEIYKYETELPQKDTPRGERYVASDTILMPFAAATLFSECITIVPAMKSCNARLFLLNNITTTSLPTQMLDSVFTQLIQEGKSS